MRIITFNQLREIKNLLPEGSTHQIADRLNLDVQTVRNYFGGTDYDDGVSMGIHIQPGPDGGYVTLEDTKILDMAIAILEQTGLRQPQQGI
ncbi:MAG: DNA-binding protein [Muribaculaceae bacterium]|nr:DNA-binding protein [Muribaculaceae bacterium]MBR1475456.1 DNA-binding protein [Muribaculaceae bacterium]MBR1727821.1 DNA-binding protein [Muribaculaceae bacterium]